MPRAHKPRSGTLQFWPRKRAKSENPRIRSWIELASTQLAGFAGYKVGMVQVSFLDKNVNARLKKQEGISPATIIECPPLKPFSIRFYKKTSQGIKIISEILAKDFNKNLARRLRLPKKAQEIKEPEHYDDIRFLVYTQPYLTSLPKKSPEIMELGITGPKEKKLEYAKSLLDKEIKISDIFKQYQQADLHAVTKGKGLQGSIQRFGLALKQHKSEKHKRATGNLGSFTPRKVPYTVAHPGQKGYHHRTIFNNAIIKIGTEKDKINPKEGWKHYGLVKNDYILIYGSVPGPVKRMIKITHAVRKKHPKQIELKGIFI